MVFAPRNLNSYWGNPDAPLPVGLKYAQWVHNYYLLFKRIFSHLSGTWVTSSPELTIRKTSKTKNMPLPRYSFPQQKAWQKSCKFMARISPLWTSIFSTFLFLHIRGSNQLYEQNRPETGNLAAKVSSQQRLASSSYSTKMSSDCKRPFGEDHNMYIHVWRTGDTGVRAHARCNVQSSACHFQEEEKARKGHFIFIQELVC